MYILRKGLTKTALLIERTLRWQKIWIFVHVRGGETNDERGLVGCRDAINGVSTDVAKLVP